jgi:hypothetical protein
VSANGLCLQTGVPLGLAGHSGMCPLCKQRVRLTAEGRTPRHVMRPSSSTAGESSRNVNGRPDPLVKAWVLGAVGVLLAVRAAAGVARSVPFVRVRP